MGALFAFVAPIAALKINFKVDWSSRQFSQNFNIWIKHGFVCNNVCYVPMGILNPEATDLLVIEGNWVS